jgi:hypothetical protein
VLRSLAAVAKGWHAEVGPSNPNGGWTEDEFARVNAELDADLPVWAARDAARSARDAQAGDDALHLALAEVAGRIPAGRPRVDPTPTERTRNPGDPAGLGTARADSTAHLRSEHRALANASGGDPAGLRALQADLDRRAAAQTSMTACPATLDQMGTSPGWKDYTGDPGVFHCGFEGFIEDRPPNEDLLNECFYDEGGALVDRSHEWNGCGGTPDAYDASQGWTDKLLHTFADPGGIVWSGGPAFLASRQYDLGLGDD